MSTTPSSIITICPANTITNYAEQITWLVFNLIILLTTILGDTSVLIGAIKYNAIQQHSVIVAVIQHLAVLDLGAALFVILPSIQVLVTNTWNLGKFLCHINANVSQLVAMMTPALICLLSTLKLIILKKPLRTAAWSFKFGHKICAGMWILALSLYAPRVVYSMVYVRDTIYFDFFSYICFYDFQEIATKVESKWYLLSVTVAFIALNAELIGTSIALLVVAKRTAVRFNETLKWEGVSAVLLTVLVYLLSTLPSLVVTVADFRNFSLNISLVRASYQLLRLGVMANFFIYCLALKSFRNFIKLRFSELCRLSLLRRDLVHSTVTSQTEISS